MATAVKRPFGRDEVVGALLDAANRLFATEAPADVSLRGIARAAGVNHGLVHRHFGTRDVLVDRLLERIAAEWTADVQSSGDFGRAIDSILGTPSEAEGSASTWLRLLAWSLLTDPPGRSGEAQRRYATLDLLPGMLRDREPGEAAITTAAALALVFGWRFFHPYIRAALHLEDASFETLHDAIGRRLRKLAEP
jgi:AcrR family transcriptional regulator